MGIGGSMSMADNSRRRSDYSSDQPADAARPQEGDPLSELARLIGQNDPFHDVPPRSAGRKPLDSVRADNDPAPDWLSRPAPHESEYDSQPQMQRANYAPPSYRDEPAYDPAHYESAHYDPARDDGRAQHGYDAQQPHDQQYASDQYSEAYQGDERYRVAPPVGDYEPESYYDDSHMPPEGEQAPVASKRRGGIVTIAAVIGLAVVGTAGAVGYRAFTSGSTSGAPPVIKADTTPAKTVPAAPAPADSKPFQERAPAGDTTATRTAPREEQPVSLPLTPARPPAAATAPQPSASAATPLVAPMPSTTSANEPKRVRTIPIRPDSAGNLDTAPASAPSRASSAPSQPSAARPGAPMLIDQSDAQSRTKTAARAPAPTPPSVATRGGYVVQVSAQKSEAEAQSSYRALQAKYPNVLSNREPMISRAELGSSGTWYRVQVGSFQTSEQATAFCENLKSAGGQCIVQRN